jgi:hypothetical protein
MTDKATPTQTALGIDYLAKDYVSFRRLMLDRLAATAPYAISGHPADLGTVLIEAVATAADQLSYYQDAVATEAYLGTARLRTSVRRHARLLDYVMHDGCNARTWVAIEVAASAAGRVLPAGTALLSRVESQPAALPASSVLEVLSSGAQLFETLHDLQLQPAHNQMALFQSALPATLPLGTTTATLADDAEDLALRVGDVLVFEETKGEDGGSPDPQRRCAVRLVSVQPGLDAKSGRRIVALRWGSADGLSCELAVARTRVSGNIVLADHGYTLPDKEPVTVPACHFRASLSKGPLTWQRMVVVNGQPEPFDPSSAASSALPTDLPPGTLLQPAIRLYDSSQRPWLPQRDLLGSSPHASDFVVEVEDDGSTALRFGDGVYGKLPPAALAASYRVGNGSAGNIGAEALYHIVSDLPGLLRARNPLPAIGGTDGEPIEQVRLHAPTHLHLQERAVTTSDYELTVRSFPEVRSAKVVRRWTGSWYTLLVTVLRAGGLDVDSDFKQRLRAYLDQYRMIGHDVQISGPVQVPLDLQLTVEVATGFWRSSVLEALRNALGSSMVGGQLGFFHPDRAVLGQPLFLSQLIAAAMKVEGVSWAQASGFRRYNGPSALGDGVIRFREFEVPLVQNLAGRPERGTLEIAIGGGQ